MRPFRLPAFVALLLAALPRPAGAAGLPDDAGLIRRFEAVAFGSEIPGLFGGGAYLKKFNRPVRFHVETLSAKDRRREVRAFIAALRPAVAGLDAELSPSAERADFVVHVVDRRDYGRVGRRVYGNPFMRVPGSCIVRAAFSRRGIRRADAIIVSDEGEPLFRRCLNEEVLQGLGLLDDDPHAAGSVFNDASKAARWSRADRLLLNILYDRRLVPGMSAKEARPLLPAIVKDARRRARQGPPRRQGSVKHNGM